MTLNPDTKVWRYMGFGKFLWMLQRKELWLSNAAQLGDKWELMPLGKQLNSHIISRSETMSSTEATDEFALIVKNLLKKTFVNCWSASEHESYALWKIFCPSSEGIAIQTTLGRLKASTGNHVWEVTYRPHEDENLLSDPFKLATQKRPMFDYEKEVRIIWHYDEIDPANPDHKVDGLQIPWDPEENIAMVRVHPEAHYLFTETVTQAVKKLAPKLFVAYSDMSRGKPF